jgi:O-antigen/teichoic acid export membrane protein
VLLALATTGGNLLGYLYQIVVAKSLGVEAFGIFTAFLGIFYFATITGTACRTGIATSIAKQVVEQGESQAIADFFRVAKLSATLLLAVPLLFAVSGPWLSSLLHSESVLPVLIVGLAIFGTLVLALALGLLQGLQKFRRLALIGYVLPQAIKLLFGTGFIVAGWHLTGALGALLISEFLPIGIALWPWRRHLLEVPRRPFRFNESMASGVSSGLLLAPFLATYTNLDVVLVVALLEDGQAGAYAATATLGKGIVFLGLAVSFVLAPRVAERTATGRPITGLVHQGLVLTVLLCGPAAATFWFFPSVLIRLFFGQEFLPAADILGLYGLAMTIFALNIVLTSCFVALRKRRGVMVANAVTLAGVGLIGLWSRSLFSVSAILLGSNALIFAYLYFAILRPNRLGPDSVKQGAQ